MSQSQGVGGEILSIPERQRRSERCWDKGASGSSGARLSGELLQLKVLTVAIIDEDGSIIDDTGYLDGRCHVSLWMLCW